MDRRTFIAGVTRPLTSLRFADAQATEATRRAVNPCPFGSSNPMYSIVCSY